MIPPPTPARRRTVDAAVHVHAALSRQAYRLHRSFGLATAPRVLVGTAAAVVANHPAPGDEVLAPSVTGL